MTTDVHDKLYEIMTDTAEITWKSIIMDLIRNEDMDPWDVDVSILTKRYIEAVKKFKETNLKMSGKVLLTAALLLRIKSTRLIGDDILEFDRLLASSEQDDDLYSEDDENSYINGELQRLGLTYQKAKDMKLIPRTPQPRKRKVSVYDLVDALEVALHVKKRRVLNQIRQKEIKIPDKKMDITLLMDNLFTDVMKLLDSGTESVAFSQIVPSESRHDKVLTFIPLLHLKNARKIDLDQPKPFEEIWIKKA